MSALKHTPGPWLANQDDMISDEESVFTIGIGTEVQTVATVSAFELFVNADGSVSPGDATQQKMEEARANALLIAAAPELLALLRLARERIDRDLQSMIESHIDPMTGMVEEAEVLLLIESEQDVLNQIDAAISKATGEKV